MANLEHELIADHDRLRIAAQRVAGRIGGRGIVGADEARSGAILFKPLFARRACLAAIDHAADTDRFSHREIGHLVAHRADMADDLMAGNARVMRAAPFARSEEHTSELQSLMRISYAVFCLKKKKQTKKT